MTSQRLLSQLEGEQWGACANSMRMIIREIKKTKTRKKFVASVQGVQQLQVERLVRVGHSKTRTLPALSA